MKRQSVLKLFMIAIFAALFISAIRAGAYLKEYDSYIEVCGKGVVKVPKDVQYVKCNGIVRKVIRIEAVLTEDMADCQCPKCCDGECYVIVTMGAEPETDGCSVEGSPPGPGIEENGSDPGGVYYLWLAC